MVDSTPPSSSANTPKREMDIDERDEHERHYSSGSDEGEPGASDTELDEAEPIETGQATPPLVEGEAGPSTSTHLAPSNRSKKARRPKDGLYESEIVHRWNRGELED
ncbi:hypothetical protein A1Q2_05796 [Trichosporon asahii var. asahii CBS 8904]|uniref:Uncharacterized protein n=1 Tax=Trichosporon asahii var. asahii (strain CBS 8904) TaxID=1220162 RepID=K1V7E0_TRIAC|nr:hypothetical protein A1Q2_05796 [Trichosporon asahii var. asahii CBS 8904]